MQTQDLNWSASYNAPGNGSDVALEMALDNNNNIYLTGKGVKITAEGYNIYTLKYNSNGQRLWAVDFTGTPGVNSNEYGLGIAIDGSGNVYVAGAAVVTNKGNEFTVLKYNTNGVLQYSKMLSGANLNASDEAYDVAVDNAGNAYACGYYYSGGQDFFSGVIIKLNPTGIVTYTKLYNGVTNNNWEEYVNQIILDNQHVIGVGTVRRDPNVNDYDMFTVKLTTAGVQSWIKYYDNVNNTVSHDYGYDVYKDAKGNIYSLGLTDTLWTMIKYDSTGAQQWVYNYDRNSNYNSPRLNSDTRPILAADSYGAVYAAGSAYKVYSGWNNTFVKFCEYPPVPTVTVSGPLTFCTGNSVSLTAPAGFEYQWNSGANTQAINANTSGSYLVTVTYPNGCFKSSTAKTVNVIPNPTPTITPGGPTTFCDGGTVTLNAGAYSAYLWNTGTTVQTLVADTTKSFTVTVTNSNGCIGVSPSVSVIEYPLPNATITATSTTFAQVTV